MIEQYFGVKELTEVTLRAKTPMTFGTRQIEAGEPVLYFENISIANLSENHMPVMARGGWANMPHVIWEERSEVVFTMQEGIMSSISMNILLGSEVAYKMPSQQLLVNKREGPYEPQELTIDNNTYVGFYLEQLPVLPPRKKVFIFEYTRDAIQKKMYGKIITRQNPLDESENLHFLAIYEDKKLEIPAQSTKQYLIDYYYEYRDEAFFLYCV